MLRRLSVHPVDEHRTDELTSEDMNSAPLTEETVVSAMLEGAKRHMERQAAF
jgi:hypothetical protein